MQTVYADASGHESNEQPFAIVAAWVSSVKDWEDLDYKWRPYVSSQCKTDCFHMTDFKANTGAFEDWKDREHEKAAFLDGLADLIERHTYQSFSVSVSVEDYRDAKANHSLDAWLGNAYAFATRGVTTLAKLWSIKEQMRWPARFVFERGDAGQDQLFAIMKRDGYPIPNFEPKCSAAGLQAADLLAWEIRQDQLIRRIPDLSSLSPPFLRFHRRRRTYWIEFKRMSFHKIAKYMQVDPHDFESLDAFKRRERREKREKDDQGSS